MTAKVIMLLMQFVTNKRLRNGCIGALAGVVAFFILLGTLLFNIVTFFIIEYENFNSLFYPMPNNTRISSSFAPRRWHPVRKEWESHNGTDFPAPQGTEVFSARPGVVSRVWYNGEEGNVVEIDHGEGVFTRYKHLYKALVKSGDEVLDRELIALCGTTGVSTGSHVHFEVKIDGEFVDAETLLREWPESEDDIFDEFCPPESAVHKNIDTMYLYSFYTARNFNFKSLIRQILFLSFSLHPLAV